MKMVALSREELLERKAKCEQLRDNYLANANAQIGQLTIIEELLQRIDRPAPQGGPASTVDKAKSQPAAAEPKKAP